MSNKLSWRDALKQFNDDRIKEGGKYTIPKKGSPEYASVRKLMCDDGDAIELKPNQTITGRDPPKPREPSKSRTPKEKQETPLPTAEKPLWNDEPKPNEKTTKLKNPKKNIPPVNSEEVIQENIKKQKSKKKTVATQTEPVETKDEDFILNIK